MNLENLGGLVWNNPIVQPNIAYCGITVFFTMFTYIAYIRSISSSSRDQTASYPDLDLLLINYYTFITS